MFEDLMQNDTTELKEMSLEDYEKNPEGDIPYLNAVKFKPNSDEKRETEDDKPILIDVNPLPPDESVDTRLRMSRADFDNVFVRTMTYMREVESITYNNIQKGIVGQAELNQMLEDYFKRNCPEIQHPVDKRQMLKRLDNAIMGYYVLQPLIDNPDTSDIKVCSPTDIRVRIKGKAYSSTSHFINEADLALFIQGILVRNNVGFKMSPVITFADSHDKHYILRFVISSPEVNAVKYPYLHIRKVNKTKPDFDELIRRGMLTENIKEYLIYRAKYSKGIVFAGPPGCYDCDTEYFNGKEWKRIADYIEGESVLQYDTNTGIASLVRPLKYIKEPCDEMYHFETKYGINQTISGEHRVLYFNRSTKGGTHYSDVKEISGDQLAVLQNNHKFHGKFKTSFNYEGNGVNLTDAEIKLMIAVIADGHFTNKKPDNFHCIINLTKERKAIELRKIFKEGHIDYNEARYDYDDGDEHVSYIRFSFYAPRKEKVYSEYWYNCNQHQFNLICNNIHLWDGYTDKKGNVSYCTTNKQSADFIQFVYSVCGYRGSIHIANRKGQTYKKSDKQEYIRKSVDYVVYAAKNPYIGMDYHKNEKNTEIIKVPTIDGYKYCFTVPTHALVMRRKNNIFISGNSGKTTLLNAFIEKIPRTRETLVIQENDELFTQQSGFMFKHVTHGFDGGRAYTLEDLGKMALVEGCNEFIIGEVKGGEMRNVMTLLNAGGYAALTVHSTNAYETLDKLADLVKYGSSYSFEEARRMLKVMDTIVYMEGYKVRHILECHGYDDKTNQFIYEEIYKYDFHDDIKKV